MEKTIHYITYFGDNINKLQSIKLGDNLSCNVNISSREYNGKYYHNIDGWACAISSNKLSESSEELTNDDLPF